MLFCSCHTWELRDEEEGGKGIPSQLCHVCGIVAAVSSFEPVSSSPSFPCQHRKSLAAGRFPHLLLFDLSSGSDYEWSFLGRFSPSSRGIRQWEMCVPIPFVPHPCLFLGGLTTWHKDSGRGLILPEQLRSISWVGETFRRRQDRAASGNLSLHGTVGALGKSGRAAFQAAHTHQWLLSTLAKFPGCLTATLCFLSGYLQV